MPTQKSPQHQAVYATSMPRQLNVQQSLAYSQLIEKEQRCMRPRSQPYPFLCSIPYGSVEPRPQLNSREVGVQSVERDRQESGNGTNNTNAGKPSSRSGSRPGSSSSSQRQQQEQQRPSTSQSDVARRLNELESFIMEERQNRRKVETQLERLQQLLVELNRNGNTSGGGSGSAKAPDS